MHSTWRRWNASPLWLRASISLIAAAAGFAWLSLAGLMAATLFGMASLRGRGSRWPGQGWWNGQEERTATATAPAPARLSERPREHRRLTN